MRLSPRHMPLLLVVVLLVAAAATVLVFPDRLLQSLHPWLGRVASDRLDARVAYQRLAVQGKRLVVEGLRLEKGGSMRLEVPRLEAEWTLRGLLNRRLEAVWLERPDLLLMPADEPGTPLPPRPPLTIPSLEISGGRILLQGEERTFEVRELDASGTLAARSPFRLAARVGEGEGLALQLAGVFDWDEPPALTLDEALWDQRPLLAAPLTVRLPASGAAAVGGVQFERLDRQHLAALQAAFRFESPLPEDWDFTLVRPEVHFRLENEDIGLRLTVPAASVSGAGLAFPLEGVQVEATGKDSVWSGDAVFRLAGAPGRVDGRLAAGRLEGEGKLSIADPAELKRRILGGDFPPLAGGLDLEARFVRTGESGMTRLQANLQGGAGHRPEVFLLDLSPLTARLTLEKPVAGELSGEGNLSAAGKEVLRWQGTTTRIEAELLASAGKDLAALLPPEHRPAFAAGVEGVAGSAVLSRENDLWQGSGRFKAAAFPLPAGVLRQVELAGVLHAGGDRLAWRQARFAGQWEGEGIAARISAFGAGEWSQEVMRLRLEKFALAGVEYLAADGLTGLTGGRLEGSGTITGAPARGLDIDLAADLGVEEVLRGSFYANLTDLPGRLILRGRFAPESRRLQVDSLQLAVQDWGKADLRGTFSPQQLQMTGAATISSLVEVLNGPVGRALAALRPGFADLRLSGAAALEGRVQLKEDDWQGEGELRLARTTVDWPSVRLAGRGIDGDIPFFFGGSEGLRRGRIRADELRLGPAAVKPQAVSLMAAAGRFAVETPLEFELAGGTLRVEEAAARIGEAAEFSAMVRLQEVDLGELTREIGLPAMAGEVTADLGRIRYRSGTLTADGTLGISVFGGDILVRNLRLESLFSSYRTVHGDLDFSGIDLHQLTRTFEFGEINGVADGYVHDLRLFGAVPSAFEARLETRDEGRRNISVKALHNISVISQGGLSAALSKGIYRFIDFYRYRKIGIFCSLENDVFILEGTARADSDDYLVYGGWLPPKINIVAPSRTISFKEMLKRLQRIDRTDSRPAGEH